MALIGMAVIGFGVLLWLGGKEGRRVKIQGNRPVLSAAAMEKLATLLMQVAFPDAEGLAPAPSGLSAGANGNSSADDIANDINKFKELLDAGIITPEEFDHKKKQILGI